MSAIFTMVQYVPVYCCCTNWQVEACWWSPCHFHRRQWCSPRLLSLLCEFYSQDFFLSKTIIFCVIFHCSNHAKSYRVFITIKPHCCSLSNIKTLVLSYIEHTRITIEWYSQILISDYNVITDIKLLSFIFWWYGPRFSEGCSASSDF